MEGSKEGKCISFLKDFGLVVPGICMSLAGAIVLGQEKAYTAISSVDIQSAPILLLVAGILSILVTGIYFKKREWTWNDILIAVRVITVLLAVAAVILAVSAGVVAIICTIQVNNKFEENLQNSMENYGRTGYETMANIDRLQKQDKCCGVFSYADWRATIYGGHRYDRVPDSCCKTEKYGCGFKFKDEATLNKRGCASIALDKMTIRLIVVGVFGIVFGIIQAILFIVLGYRLCKKGPQDQDYELGETAKYNKTGPQGD